ncbi:hypothetical protein F0U59_40895 [Archangium gephyra]|nr:hypothetical protein F0U59_40895 [Archangium gephyra]
MINQPLRTWSIDNVEIKGETHWWGFVLHLNEDATQLLEEIDKYAAKLTAALPAEAKPVASLIKYYLKLRNVVIKLEDKGQGVRLVSPWIMPTLLVPLPDNRHVDDSQLRWSTFSSDSGGEGPWSDEQKLQQVFSESGPSLAVFQEKLFCVARGAGNDQALWWMTFDGGWSPYQKISDHVLSAAAPALAVFQGKLHVVARGAGSDQTLWWMTYDGNAWSAYQRISEHVLSADGPALAEFDGKLHLVARGAGKDTCLWWMTYDGRSWSTYQKISDYVFSENGPALAKFDGKLHLVARGTGKDQNLWWMTYDGYAWSTYRKISDYVFSADTPALAEFQGKLHLLSRGSGKDQNLWWMTYDGGSWSQYRKIDNVYSAYKPGLANYRDPNGTRDQLLCVHRGLKT